MRLWRLFSIRSRAGSQGTAREPQLKTLLALFLCSLLPAGLSAQTAGPSRDLLDGWRARLATQLEGDIARLTAAHDPETRAIPTQIAAGSEQPPAQPKISRLLGGKSDSSSAGTLAAILHEQGLPASLVSVAAVESGFNPQALSPKGARGLWQLMPATARRFGLVVSATRDERTDPVKSTVAAAQYLKSLHSQFGSWPLALAAYNAGEERVQRSLELSGARDFWTLSRASALPAETLHYVPAVLERLGGSLSHSNAVVGWMGSPSGSWKTMRGGGSRPSAQVVFAMTSPAE